MDFNDEFESLYGNIPNQSDSTDITDDEKFAAEFDSLYGKKEPQSEDKTDNPSTDNSQKNEDNREVKRVGVNNGQEENNAKNDEREVRNDYKVDNDSIAKDLIDSYLKSKNNRNKQERADIGLGLSAVPSSTSAIRQVFETSGRINKAAKSIGNIEDGAMFLSEDGTAWKFSKENFANGKDPRVPVSRSEYAAATNKGVRPTWRSDYPATRTPEEIKADIDKWTQEDRDAKNRVEYENDVSALLESKFGKTSGQAQIGAEYLPADNPNDVGEKAVALANKISAFKGGTINHFSLPMHIDYNADGKVEGYGTVRSIVVPEIDGSFSVIPTIRGENGSTIEMPEDEAKEWYRYTQTDEYAKAHGTDSQGIRLANFKPDEEKIKKLEADVLAGRITSKEAAEQRDKLENEAYEKAKQASIDIHEFHQEIYRNKWNQYIHEHWDEMSDEIKNSEGEVHDAWVKIGSPLATFDVEQERKWIADKNNNVSLPEKRNRSISEDLVNSIVAETGDESTTVMRALVAYMLPMGVYSEKKRAQDYQDESVRLLYSNDPDKRMEGWARISAFVDAKDRASQVLSFTNLPWYSTIVTGGAKNFGYTTLFAIGSMAGAPVGAAMATRIGASATAASAISGAAELALPVVASTADRFGDLSRNDYQIGQDGELIVNSYADSTTVAGAKACVGAVAESVVEKYLEKAIAPIWKVPFMRKVRGNLMRNIAKNPWMADVARGYAKFSRYTGFNGLGSELLEEDAQAVIDDVFQIGKKNDEFTDIITAFRESDTFTAKGQLEILLSMIGTMALQGAVGGYVQHQSDKRYGQAVKQYVSQFDQIQGIDPAWSRRLSDRQKVALLNLYNKFSDNPVKLKEISERMFGKDGALDILFERLSQRSNIQMNQTLSQRGVTPASFKPALDNNGQVKFEQKLVVDPSTGQKSIALVAYDEDNGIVIYDRGENLQNGEERFIIASTDLSTVERKNDLNAAVFAADNIAQKKQVDQLNNEDKLAFIDKMVQQENVKRQNEADASGTVANFVNIVPHDNARSFLALFANNEKKLEYAKNALMRGSAVMKIGDNIHIILPRIYTPAQIEMALSREMQKNANAGTMSGVQPTSIDYDIQILDIPTEPTNPTAPTAPTNPTEHTAPTAPADPIDPTNPVDPTEHTDPTAPNNIPPQVDIGSFLVENAREIGNDITSAKDIAGFEQLISDLKKRNPEQAEALDEILNVVKQRLSGDNTSASVPADTNSTNGQSDADNKPAVSPDNADTANDAASATNKTKDGGDGKGNNAIDGKMVNSPVKSSVDSIGESSKTPLTENEKHALQGAVVAGAKASADETASPLSFLSSEVPIVRLNPAKLDRSDSVLPNMKKGANRKTGITTPLAGEWHPSMAGIGAVWLTKDGKLVVITGRHRTELAERNGKSMLYYLFREADGFTKEDAQAYDAIANIHDEKGEINDYISFFDRSNITREQAEQSGLLQGKGGVAWSLSKDASDDVRRATEMGGSPGKGKISPRIAAIIARSAPIGENPANASIQNHLLKVALKKDLTQSEFEFYAKQRASELKNRKVNSKILDGAQMDLFTSPEDIARDLLAQKESKYRIRKAEEYSSIARNIRAALNGEGKLQLAKEYAKELGITNIHNKNQLVAAYEAAVAKANYWKEANFLEDADKEEMQRAIEEEIETKGKRSAGKSGRAKNEGNVLPGDASSDVRGNRKDNGRDVENRTRPRPVSRGNGGHTGIREEKGRQYEVITTPDLKSPEYQKQVDAIKAGHVVSAVDPAIVSKDNGTPIPFSSLVIKDETDAAILFQNFLYDPRRETAKVMFLDANGNVIVGNDGAGVRLIGVGKVGTVSWNAKEILDLVPNNCDKIIVSHNHPSGIPSPSAADIAATKKLQEIIAKKHPGVSFDHIITDTDRFYSFNKGKTIRANIVDNGGALTINPDKQVVATDENINNVISTLMSGNNKNLNIIVGIGGGKQANGGNRILHVAVLPDNPQERKALIEHGMPGARMFAIGVGENGIGEVDSIVEVLQGLGEVKKTDANGNETTSLSSYVKYVYSGGKLTTLTSANSIDGLKSINVGTKETPAERERREAFDKIAETSGVSFVRVGGMVWMFGYDKKNNPVVGKKKGRDGKEYDLHLYQSLGWDYGARKINGSWTGVQAFGIPYDQIPKGSRMLDMIDESPDAFEKKTEEQARIRDERLSMTREERIAERKEQEQRVREERWQRENKSQEQLREDFKKLESEIDWDNLGEETEDPWEDPATIREEDIWSDRKASEQEYQDVYNRYHNADGTPKPGWLKAPNGKPTNLTERRWVQVNTLNFKANYFGFYNLPKHQFNIVSVQAAPFSSVKDGVEWTKSNGVIGVMQSSETNGKGEINISAGSVAEMLNLAQMNKSVSKEAHFAALTQIRNIIRESELADRHPHYAKGADGKRDTSNGVIDGVFVDVLYGAMRLGGETYRVKTTLRRYKDTNRKTKAYAYEVSEIEVLAGKPGSPESSGTSSTSITGDILLNGVRNSKGELVLEDFSKVVDENGEPRVVYHGSPNDFTAFRRDFLGSTTRGAGTEWGFYFSASEDLARAVVEDYSGQEAKVIEGYLNIRNPLRVDLKDYDGDLDAALEQLQDSDYDGAVISGLVDHGIESENFLVLDGKQVKSATDNIGTFDPANPDILMEDTEGSNTRKMTGLDKAYSFLMGCATSSLRNGVVSTYNEFKKQMADMLGDKFSKVGKFLPSVYNNARLDVSDEVRRRMTPESEVNEIAVKDAGLKNRGKDAIGNRVPSITMEHLVPTPTERVKESDFNGGLDFEQRKGVNLALDAISKDNGSFMIADGTGFGKTRQLIAIGEMYQKEHPNANILFISENKDLLRNEFTRDAEALGVDFSKFKSGTYTGLANGDFSDGRTWNLVILDEAHNLANSSSHRTQAYMSLPIDHVVFATATPMDRNTDAAYFFARLNNADPNAIAISLGYRLTNLVNEKNGQEYIAAVNLSGQDDQSIRLRIIAERDKAISSGKMIRRYYPFLGSIETTEYEAVKEHSENEAKITSFYEQEIADLKRTRRIYYRGTTYFKDKIPDKHRARANVKVVTDSDRWGELIRSKKIEYKNSMYQAIDKLNEHYKGTRAALIANEIISANDKARVIVVGNQVGDQFIKSEGTSREGELNIALKGFDSLTDRMGVKYVIPPSLKIVEDTLVGQYGVDSKRIAHIDAKHDRTTNRNDFVNHRKPIMLMTGASGGTGINLDDTVGEYPTTMVVLSPDYSMKKLMQLLGRISRKNTASTPTVIFLKNNSVADAHRATVNKNKASVLGAIQGSSDIDAIIENNDSIEFNEDVENYTQNEIEAEEEALQILQEDTEDAIRSVGSLSVEAQIIQDRKYSTLTNKALAGKLMEGDVAARSVLYKRFMGIDGGGVQYTKKNGSKVYTTLPVILNRMFKIPSQYVEDLCHVIWTKRLDDYLFGFKSTDENGNVSSVKPDSGIINTFVKDPVKGMIEVARRVSLDFNRYTKHEADKLGGRLKGLNSTRRNNETGEREVVVREQVTLDDTITGDDGEESARLVDMISNENNLSSFIPLSQDTLYENSRKRAALILSKIMSFIHPNKATFLTNVINALVSANDGKQGYGIDEYTKLAIGNSGKRDLFNNTDFKNALQAAYPNVKTGVLEARAKLLFNNIQRVFKSVLEGVEDKKIVKPSLSAFELRDDFDSDYENSVQGVIDALALSGNMNWSDIVSFAKEGMRSVDIARELGITEAAVSTALKEIKAKYGLDVKSLQKENKQPKTTRSSKPAAHTAVANPAKDDNASSVESTSEADYGQMEFDWNEETEDVSEQVTIDAVNKWRSRHGELSGLHGYEKQTIDDLQAFVDKQISNRRNFESRMEAMISNPNFALTPEETAELSRYIVELQREYESLMAKRDLAKNNGNTGLAEDCQRQMNAIISPLTKAQQANRRFRNIWGKAGRAMQLAIKNDYSFTKIVVDCERIKGAPLTDEERAIVESLVRPIRDKQIHLDAVKLADMNKLFDSLIKDWLKQEQGKIQSQKLVGKSAQTIKRNFNNAMLQLKFHGEKHGGLFIEIPNAKQYLNDLQRYHLLIGDIYNNDGTPNEKMALEKIIEDLNSVGITADEWQVRQTLTDMGISTTPPQDQLEIDRRKLNSLHLVEQQIAYIEKFNEVPPVTGYRRDAPDVVLRELRKRRAQLIKEKGLDANKEANRLKTALESSKTRLRNKIEDLLSRVPASMISADFLNKLKSQGVNISVIGTNLEKIEKDNKNPNTDAEKLALAESAKSLTEIYEEAYPKSEEELLEDRVVRAMNAIKRQIGVWDERIVRALSGDFSKDPAAPELKDPRLDALRDQLQSRKDMWQSLHDALFPEGTAEEIEKQVQTRLKVLNNRLQVIEGKIKAYNNATSIEDKENALKTSHKDKPSWTSDPRIAALSEQIERDKAMVEQFKRDLKEAKKSPVVKAFSKIGDAVSFTRLLRTSMDISAVLTQGGVMSLANPKEAARTILRAIRAIKPEQADAINYALKNDPYFSDFIEHGGHTYGGIDKPESFRGLDRSFLVKIPGVGSMVSASERAFTTYLNSFALELYKMFVRSDEFGSAGPSAEQKEAMARAVNHFLGYGYDSKSSNAIVDTIMFAPKLVVGSMKTAFATDVWLAPAVAPDLKNYTVKQRTQVAKTIGKKWVKAIAIGIAVQAALKLLWDDDPDKDKDDWLEFFFGVGDTKKFLRPSRGSSHLMIGLHKIVRWWNLIGKIVSIPFGDEFEKGNRTQEFGDLLQQEMRKVLSPVASVVWDSIDGKDILGRKIDWGKFSLADTEEDRPDISGVYHIIENLVVPLFIADMAAAYRHGGAGGMAVEAAPLILGAQVQHYKNPDDLQQAYNDYQEYNRRMENAKISGDEDKIKDLSRRYEPRAEAIAYAKEVNKLNNKLKSLVKKRKQVADNSEAAKKYDDEIEKYKQAISEIKAEGMPYASKHGWHGVKKWMVDK